MSRIQVDHENKQLAYERATVLVETITHILFVRESCSIANLRKAISLYEIEHPERSLDNCTDQDIENALAELLSGWRTFGKAQYHLRVIVRKNEIRFKLISREIPPH